MENKSKIDPFELAKWGLLAVGGFLVYKTLRGLGIVKSAEEKKEEQKIKSIDVGTFAPLSPLYYKNLLTKNKGYPIKILTSNNTKAYIANLLAAKGLINDDEAVIYRVFNSIPYQSQISYLAGQFNIKTNKDLNTYLTDILSDSEKIKLINIIESKQIGIMDPKTNKVIQ